MSNLQRMKSREQSAESKSKGGMTNRTQRNVSPNQISKQNLGQRNQSHMDQADNQSNLLPLSQRTQLYQQSISNAGGPLSREKERKTVPISTVPV